MPPSILSPASACEEEGQIHKKEECGPGSSALCPLARRRYAAKCMNGRPFVPCRYQQLGGIEGEKWHDAALEDAYAANLNPTFHLALITTVCLFEKKKLVRYSSFGLVRG